MKWTTMSSTFFFDRHERIGPLGAGSGGGTVVRCEFDGRTKGRRFVSSVQNEWKGRLRFTNAVGTPVLVHFLFAVVHFSHVEIVDAA